MKWLVWREIDCQLPYDLEGYQLQNEVEELLDGVIETSNYRLISPSGEVLAEWKWIPSLTDLLEIAERIKVSR